MYARSLRGTDTGFAHGQSGRLTCADVQQVSLTSLVFFVLSLLSVVLVLTGCGGGAGPNSGPSSNQPPPGDSLLSVTVSGNIAGLNEAGLKLTVGSTELAVDPAATKFTIQATTNMTIYTVRISNQPAGQVCVLANNEGYVRGPARDVEVVCARSSATPLSGTFRIDGQRNFVTFFPDGTFLAGSHLSNIACGENDGNGVEHGIYDWNSSSSMFSVTAVVMDTNGTCGLANGVGNNVGVSGTLERSGSTAILHAADGTSRVLVAVEDISGSIQGSWNAHIDFDGVIVFLPDSTYFQMRSHQRFEESGEPTGSGIEDGCYRASVVGTTSPTTAWGNLTVDLSRACVVASGLRAIDTNGYGGLSVLTSAVAYSINEPNLTYGPGFPNTFAAFRVVTTE